MNRDDSPESGNDSADFERFLTGREAIGQAYITGDARPLARSYDFGDA